jgi:hypothetical protein
MRMVQKLFIELKILQKNNIVSPQKKISKNIIHQDYPGRIEGHFKKDYYIIPTEFNRK